MAPLICILFGIGGLLFWEFQRNKKNNTFQYWEKKLQKQNIHYTKVESGLNVYVAGISSRNFFSINFEKNSKGQIIALIKGRIEELSFSDTVPPSDALLSFLLNRPFIKREKETENDSAVQISWFTGMCLIAVIIILPLVFGK